MILSSIFIKISDMKRTAIFFIALVVCMMSLSSCATMLPQRFETFSNNVENNSENYNLRKWERKNAKFLSLCEQYKDNFALYSGPQRRKIHSSMATYVKSAAKSGAVTITDALSDITEQIGGLVEDAKALFEEIGLKKKSQSPAAPPAR